MHIIDVNKLQNEYQNKAVSTLGSTFRESEEIDESFFIECLEILKKNKLLKLFFEHSEKKPNNQTQSYKLEIDKKALALIEKSDVACHKIFCDFEKFELFFDSRKVGVDFAHKLGKRLQQISKDMGNGKGELKMQEEKGV